MAQSNMTWDEVLEALHNCNATGNAKLKGSDLYIQHDENSNWYYYGTVSDVELAHQTIQDFFNF